MTEIEAPVNGGPPQLEIERPVAQAILSYLVTRPYIEVHELVRALQGLKEPE